MLFRACISGGVRPAASRTPVIRTLLVCLIAVPLAAQPDPAWLDRPCPQQSRDLFPIEVGPASLVLGMNVTRTEDVPSSAGHCIQVITTAPQASFLYVIDQRGNPDHYHPLPGNMLHPDSLGRDLAWGRMRWHPGLVELAHRGYGSFFTDKSWHPIHPNGTVDLVMRTTMDGTTWLIAFRVRTNTSEGFESLTRLGMARDGGILRW